MTLPRTLLQQAVLGKLEGLVRLDEGEWGELQEMATIEGLDGLLYQRCRKAGLVLPQPVEATLQSAYRGTAGWNFAALQELGSILETLAASGIELLVMPGAALLPLYPDPGCRPMDDIDVLVEPGAESRVKEALRGCGFVSPARHGSLFVRDGRVLDLHADLLNCDRIRTRRHAGWMAPQAVWDARIDQEIEGVGVTTMCLEDTMLYTAVHALRHSFSRFTWFIDLHGLLWQPLDWKRLRERAVQFRLERSLLYGLRYLRERLDLELPGPAREWVTELTPGAVELRLLERTFDRGSAGEWGDLLWSFSISGFWKRWWFLGETAFPRPAVLLQVFPFLPRPLFPLAYGLRLGQLLGWGAKLVAGIARRSAR